MGAREAKSLILLRLLYWALLASPTAVHKFLPGLCHRNEGKHSPLCFRHNPGFEVTHTEISFVGAGKQGGLPGGGSQCLRAMRHQLDLVQALFPARTWRGRGKWGGGKCKLQWGLCGLCGTTPSLIMSASEVSGG